MAIGITVLALVLIGIVLFIAIRRTREESRQEALFGGDTLFIEDDLGIEVLFEPSAFYFGTLMGSTHVGPRYRLDHMYLRGPGALTLTPRYLKFKRLFDPGSPACIPLDRVRSVSEGKGIFANYWLPGRKVLLVHWAKKGRLLTSGFAVSPAAHSRWRSRLGSEAQKFILK